MNGNPNAIHRRVTKHRNPWKGLKQKKRVTLSLLFSCYKAQKSLEGIETILICDFDFLTFLLQSTEIPGRD